MHLLRLGRGEEEEEEWNGVIFLVHCSVRTIRLSLLFSNYRYENKQTTVSTNKKKGYFT